MSYMPHLHYCCGCKVYLGPDNGDGICAGCDIDSNEECLCSHIFVDHHELGCIHCSCDLFEFQYTIEEEEGDNGGTDERTTEMAPLE
jgi:hypothetical protein